MVLLSWFNRTNDNRMPLRMLFGYIKYIRRPGWILTYPNSLFRWKRCDCLPFSSDDNEGEWRRPFNPFGRMQTIWWYESQPDHQTGPHVSSFMPWVSLLVDSSRHVQACTEKCVHDAHSYAFIQIFRFCNRELTGTSCLTRKRRVYASYPCRLASALWMGLDKLSKIQRVKMDGRKKVDNRNYGTTGTNHTVVLY